MKVSGIYLRSSVYDNGQGQAPDYTIHHFSQVTDEDGKDHGTKYFKETKLITTAKLKKGDTYNITLHKEKYPYGHPLERNKLPYPIRIETANYVFIRHGGRIISHSKEDNSFFDITNHREVDYQYRPIDGKKLFDGNNRNIQASVMNLAKDKLTEKRLLYHNNRGTFFKIAVIDPRDKRKSQGPSYSAHGDKTIGNHLIIKHTNTMEKNRVLERYMSDDLISKHFTVEMDVFPAK